MCSDYCDALVDEGGAFKGIGHGQKHRLGNKSVTAAMEESLHRTPLTLLCAEDSVGRRWVMKPTGTTVKVPKNPAMLI